MASPWEGKDVMMLRPASGEVKDVETGYKAPDAVCWGNRCGLRIQVGMCRVYLKSPIH